MREGIVTNERLIFIHGAGFTGEVFAAQLDAFPGAHAPNLPGHLTAGSPAGIPEFAAFVEAYARDETGGAGVVLCGHSMGGAVALEAALRANIPVRALVLLGSGARLRVAPAILDGLREDFDATVEQIAPMLFADPEDELVAGALDSMRRVGAEQTRRDYCACDAFDVRDRLAELDVPLLAITGELDRMTPVKLAQTLVDRVPAAAARRVDGAGHMVMVERPAETNALIKSFLPGSGS